MIRLVFAVVIFALVALVILVPILGVKYLIQRSKLKELARYAPELLEYHEVPAPVSALIVEQRKQLQEATRLMRNALGDQAVLIPSEYANPMEDWIDNNRRKLR
jgi:hypothetical protein